MKLIATRFFPCVAALLLTAPIASAQTTLESAVVDLFSFTTVSGGTSDSDNPPAEPASGTQNWNVSASSVGTGNTTANGNFTSEVEDGYFSLSGTAFASKSGATSGGSANANALLRVKFTVSVLSEASLSLSTTILSANLNQNLVYGALYLYENSDLLIGWEAVNSTLLSDTVFLTPGNTYTFEAALQASFDFGNGPTTQINSASGDGISMSVTAVPEPSTYALLTGAAVWAAAAMRRKKKGQPVHPDA